MLDPRFKQRVSPLPPQQLWLSKCLFLSMNLSLQSRTWTDQLLSIHVYNKMRLRNPNHFYGRSVIKWWKKKSDSKASPESVECVVDTYLKELNQPRKSNPLQYWKEHKQLWPILVSLAFKYLCAPPSSVATERLFSTAGDISTETRNCLLKCWNNCYFWIRIYVY